MSDEKCPIGMDAHRQFCSAGTCKPCLVDRIEWLTAERDKYKQIAELNLQTVRTIHGAPHHAVIYNGDGSRFCVTCQEIVS